MHPYLVSELKTAIQHQDDIGWNNVTTGFIAEAWIHVIKAYKKHHGIKDLSPENWMRRFLQASLDWSHYIWKSRCKYVHESERSSLNCFRQVLFNRWTYLLDNRHELGYHTFLLKRQGNFLFTATKRNLELWESRINKAIQATKEHNRKLIKPTIPQHFPYIKNKNKPRKVPSRRKKYMSAHRKRLQRIQALNSLLKKIKPINHHFQTRKSTSPPSSPNHFSPSSASSTSTNSSDSSYDIFTPHSALFRMIKRLRPP